MRTAGRGSSARAVLTNSVAAASRRSGFVPQRRPKQHARQAFVVLELQSRQNRARQRPVIHTHECRFCRQFEKEFVHDTNHASKNNT